MPPEKPQSLNFWLSSSFTLLILSYICYRMATTTADPDLWGYMSFGRLFWAGKFPYHDVFSYVPTLPLWVYHEWLTGTLCYPLYKMGGAPALQIIKYAVVMGTLGLVFLTARVRGAHPLAAALIIAAIIGSLRPAYAPVRAQIFTYFFFALSLYLLEKARKTQNWKCLYFHPVILIIWCNLHGGFVAGLGLIALYGIGEGLSKEPFRPYLLILLLSAIATLVNPYGLEYWRYIIRAIVMPRPEIAEWASLFQAVQVGLLQPYEIFYLIVFAGFSLMLVYRAPKPEGTVLLALGLTLILTVLTVRHLPFYILLVGAYLPLSLRTYEEDLKSRPRFVSFVHRFNNKALAVPILFLAAALFWGFLGQKPFHLELPQTPGYGAAIHYPLGAVNYMRHHGLSGKVLVSFNWGEYLIWNFYPRCLVALDGRYETVYPENICKAYFDFLYARHNWKEFLHRYPPDMILIDSRSKLYDLLRWESGWREVYADPGAALFLKPE